MRFFTTSQPLRGSTTRLHLWAFLRCLRYQTTLVKVQGYHRVVLYANLLFIPDFYSRPCCPLCSRTSCGPRTLPLMENYCFLLLSLLVPALSVDGLRDADLCVINDTITSHLPQTLSCGLNSIIFMFLVVHFVTEPIPDRVPRVGYSQNRPLPVVVPHEVT